MLREAPAVGDPVAAPPSSDVATLGDVPADGRHSMLLWVGCIAGALRIQVRRRAEPRGSEGIEIEPMRVCDIEDREDSALSLAVGP